MPRIARGLAVLALAAVAGWVATAERPAGGAESPGQTATVVEVLDGDTVVVDVGQRTQRVRLIGIDAPEAHDSPKLDRLVERGHDRARVLALGRRAAAFARDRLSGRRVRLEFDVERHDRYGRLLAYLWLPDGTLFNATLLEEGQARLLTIPPNVRYVDRFVALERAARRARRGLWGHPTTPGRAPR